MNTKNQTIALSLSAKRKSTVNFWNLYQKRNIRKIRRSNDLDPAPLLYIRIFIYKKFINNWWIKNYLIYIIALFRFPSKERFYSKFHCFAGLTVPSRTSRTAKLISSHIRVNRKADLDRLCNALKKKKNIQLNSSIDLSMYHVPTITTTTTITKNKVYPPRIKETLSTQERCRREYDPICRQKRNIQLISRRRRPGGYYTVCVIRVRIRVCIWIDRCLMSGKT